ncbi:MAG: type IV secretion system protein VirB10 [Neisseriaceae bacterium]|nr:type IV secretion system protein VirB10 [Neisseriaceae bacterium]
MKWKFPKREENGVDMTQPETLAEQVDDNVVEPMLVQESQGNKGTKGIKKAGMALALFLGSLLVVGSLMMMMGGEEKSAEENTTDNSIATDVEQDGMKGVNLDNDKDEIAEAEAKRLAELERQASEPADNNAGDASSQPVVVAQAPASEPQVNPILERRLGGGVLVNEGNLKEPANETAEVQVANQGDTGGNNDEKSFNLQGTVFTPRVASQRGDKTLLLTRGTTIPCVLVTKIVTDHAGITKCQATKDVWSANGKTVLIERGSIFMGEQTAAMLQGEARVAVRWTQLETPKGVLVQIDSPSVGKLGASGNEAWVNHHFWKRFGGSVMISLIGDLSAGLGKRLSKRQADVTFEQSNENAKSMAEEALRNSINIPPTGTINQGALLNIMVARDVDFKNVYERVDLSDYSQWQ